MSLSLSRTDLFNMTYSFNTYWGASFDFKTVEDGMMKGVGLSGDCEQTPDRNRGANEPRLKNKENLATSLLLW